MSLRFIRVTACNRTLFLFKGKDYIPVHAHDMFLYHLLVDEYLGCFHFLACPPLGYYKNLCSGHACANIFKVLFSSFSYTYEKAGFLDHKVILFLIFWGFHVIFNNSCTFYISASRFQFPCILANSFFCFSDSSILQSLRWCVPWFSCSYPW